MPDADIPPVVLSDEDIALMQADMPSLPSTYRDAWSSLGIDRSVIESLLSTQNYAILISEIQQKYGDNTARRVAHWFSSSVAQTGEEETIIATNFTVEGYGELAAMVEKNELSSTAAKEVFQELLTSAESPIAIATRKDLLQVSDESAILEVVREVLNDPASAQSVSDIRAGQDKAIGFLVGQVMKKSQGKANPALAQKLIRQELA